MFHSLKKLGFLVSFVGSMLLFGAIITKPAVAQLQPVPTCIPICASQTGCDCPRGQYCVWWFNPQTATACLSPLNPPCKTKCFGGPFS